MTLALSQAKPASDLIAPSALGSGTIVLQAATGATSIPTYTWTTLPITATIGTLALFSDSWAGDGAAVTAAPISVLLQFKNNDATQPWEPLDTTNPQWVTFSDLAASGAYGSSYTNRDTFTCPAKITMRLRVKGAFGVPSASGQTAGVAAATTTGGSDIVAKSGGVVGFMTDLALTTASADTTFAAAAKLYLTGFNSGTGSSLNYAEWQAKLVKLAGRA